MICTLLTFFCFAWQISPSLSACAQAAVSVSFGSRNASFLRVKAKFGGWEQGVNL